MTRERRRYWLWAGTALVTGLLLRLWFVAHMARVSGDTLIYGDIAINLLRHGIYGFTETGAAPGSIEIRPTLIRLPGYPLFLATCFRIFGIGNYRAVMFVQVAADLVTCWLASALAGRLFGRRAALAVLWLAAVCPFTASYVGLPLTEPLTLTSIALTLYGFARWQDTGLGYNRWLWVVAAALGYSILLRPEQVLLAVAVLPAMLWRSLATRATGSRLSESALPVLAAALYVILPLVSWTARNWHTFHTIQPLAPRYATDQGELAPIGFGRWFRTWAIDFASTEEVYWNYNGDRIELTDLPSRAFDTGSQAGSEDLRNRTAALLADYNATTIVTPAIDARFATLAAERIRAHPTRFRVGLPITRLLDMILRPRTEMMQTPLEWWRWREHRAQTAFAASYATLNFAYIALGMAGFFAWKRRAWRSTPTAGTPPCGYRELAFAMAASLILRAALLLTLDNSEARYTLEFFPVLFVLAGAVFASTVQSPTENRVALG
ncbi:MAG TPA: glycosyltransferase family 39 protein [Acidobacteriaceae bacterium]